jgi:hypothetical protein
MAAAKRSALAALRTYPLARAFRESCAAFKAGKCNLIYIASGIQAPVVAMKACRTRPADRDFDLQLQIAMRHHLQEHSVLVTSFEVSLRYLQSRGPVAFLQRPVEGMISFPSDKQRRAERLHPLETKQQWNCDHHADWMRWVEEVLKLSDDSLELVLEELVQFITSGASKCLALSKGNSRFDVHDFQFD